MSLWRKGILEHCWWEYKLVQLLKKSMVIHQKLKIELPYDLSIPLLSMNTKEIKSLSQRDL